MVQTSDTGILPDRLNAEAQSSQRFAEKILFAILRDLRVSALKNAPARSVVSVWS